jgi:predicted MFS family arabinose efflux permease
MTAAGYAMCTIAAQGFIVQVTASRQRAQGVSSFVGVLMAASICGTAIGGILADRVGYRAVFLCAAALAVVAGVLALRMLSSDAAGPTSIQRSRFRLADLRLLLANWRFVALLLFAAIPGKIVLTGYLFYAVPLVLASLAASESEIGRIMMVYSIVIVLLGPWLSRFADERGHSWAMVFAGTLVSGLGMALLYFRADTYGVLAGVVVIAVAHAASISPQVALVPDICRREIEKIGQTTVLSILRMVERVGSVIGPLLVASLVAQFGFVDGLAVIGLGIAALSFLLLTAFAGGRGKREV